VCVCKRVEASRFNMHDFSTTDNVWCGRVCLCVCKRVEASHFDMHDFSTTDNVCMCVCAKVESHSWRGRACFKHTHTHKHIPDTFHCFPGSSEKLYTLRPEQRGVNGRKALGGVGSI